MEPKLFFAVILAGLALFALLAAVSILPERRLRGVGRYLREDITDPKKAARIPRELQPISAELAALRARLASQEEEVRRSEQRRQELTAFLAHDLKTPLTSVIGYLTLLRDERQISEELRQKYVTISLGKAERLEDLINEFFEITRFNLSHFTLQYSKVNLTRLLEQLIFEFRPMFEEKQLQCALQAPADTMLRCDADRMQRVFDNLLRNAVFYSFENSTIEIAVSQKDRQTSISFTNSGNTIPPEKLSRIFEQFYRLDTSRNSQNGGAGLGLAIAKEIVELHGGTISASSGDDVIQFDITIP